MINFNPTVMLTAFAPMYEQMGLPVEKVAQVTNRVEDIEVVNFYIEDMPEEIHVVVNGQAAWELATEYGLTQNGMSAAFMAIDGIPHIFIDITHACSDELRCMVAHELVHYEQWKRGDLEYTDRNTIIWKGVECTPITNILENSDEYFLQPWEREAYLATLNLMPQKAQTKLRKLYGMQ